jgi:DNA-binding transcriptional LysR family regulator
MWFGVLGAPLAWTGQHIAGYALTEAACDEARWNVHMDTWVAVVSAAAAVVAVAAGVAAVVTYLATRDAEDELPGSRIKFLAIIGITITPLFFAMIVMSGLGSVLLPQCHQG